MIHFIAQMFYLFLILGALALLSRIGNGLDRIGNALDRMAPPPPPVIAEPKRPRQMTGAQRIVVWFVGAAVAVPIAFAGLDRWHMGEMTTQAATIIAGMLGAVGVVVWAVTRTRKL